MGEPDIEVTSDLHERPVDILRALIQFETVNPPGNERPCIEWIGDVLETYGIEYELYAKDPDRPNLMARIPGGDADSLMLYGHVDVVPVTDQEWTYDPFAAEVADGMVWGRGALDMKDGVAMYLATFLRVHVEDEPPAGDLLLLVVSDEEAGGDVGLRFLVEEHPELFDDVGVAIGEFGGFPMAIGETTFYPIQVNEKQVCWLEATFTGNSGHASLPTEDTAMGKLGRFLAAVDEHRLPVHLTPTVERMLEAMADGLPEAEAALVTDMLDPARTDAVLDELPWDARILDAVTHNTANPTIIEGGDKENVVPEAVRCRIDCRLVPDQTPADVIAELEAVAGDDAVFEVVRFDEGPPPASLAHFDLLADVLESATGTPTIPMMMFGATDARHLATVGVESYGFIPLNMEDIPMLDLLHSGDERVPVDSVEWGTELIHEAISRYDG